MMARRVMVAAGVFFLIVSLGSAAFAQSDCKKLVPASPWGPNDQTGATNRVTASLFAVQHGLIPDASWG